MAQWLGSAQALLPWDPQAVARLLSLLCWGRVLLLSSPVYCPVQKNNGARGATGRIKGCCCQHRLTSPLYFLHCNIGCSVASMRYQGGLSLPKKFLCKEVKSECRALNSDAQHKHSLSGLMARGRRLCSESRSPSEDSGSIPAPGAPAERRGEERSAENCPQEKQSCSHLPAPSFCFWYSAGIGLYGSDLQQPTREGGTLQEVEGSDTGLPPRMGWGRSVFERLCMGSRKLRLGRPLWGRGEELYGTIMGLNRKKKGKYCTKMIIKT